jgi:hypothetical protein
MIVGAIVNGDYQVNFNGIYLGPGTPYGITKFSGFNDLSGVRANYVSRPHKTGAYSQPHYADGAVLGLEFDITATSSVSFPDAVAQLQAATFAQTDPLPLTFKLPGRPALTVGVQTINRSIPTEVGSYEFGLSQKAGVQWYAPDPRLYGATQYASAPLRGTGSGLVYPLTYPLDYGTPASGGSLSFTNTGSAATEPIFTVSGPLSQGFIITYVETGQHLTYSAPVGSSIVVDCSAGTATTQGQDRTVFLTQRDWFSVAPGATATFAFATLGVETPATSPSVNMSCQFAPAYL